MKKAVLIAPVVILLTMAGIAVAGRYRPKASPAFVEPALAVYHNKQYDVEVDYPATWAAYGNMTDIANPDLLAFRIFVPDFDAHKSSEQQSIVSLNIWRKNPETVYDAPKRFMQRIRANEVWEKIEVNGYPATKITDATTRTVIAYVFDHDGRLYTLEAATPGFLDILLPTLKFL
jgi:hypothetical protein